MRIRHWFVIGITASAAFGCAGSRLPAQEVAETRAAMRAAGEIGAGEVPRGELHLRLAQDQLALAERYIAEDEEVLAREALSRARQDAELALALAKEQAAIDAAKEARRRVQQLQSAAGTGTPTEPSDKR
jgi:pyridoxal biosynthesis lyase PdxS